MIGVITSGSIGSTRSRLRALKASGPSPVIVLVVAAPVSAALVVTGMCPLVVHIVAGLFVLIVLPVVLVNAKINWPESTKLHESLLYSLALVVLGLMVGGLAINDVLPFVGIARPLDRVTGGRDVVDRTRCTCGCGDANAGAGRDGLSAETERGRVAVIGWRDQARLVVGAILVVGSVAGADQAQQRCGWCCHDRDAHPCRRRHRGGFFLATAFCTSRQSW